MRREVALALRNVPAAQSLPLLQTLMNQYDGTDRYYLTALGIGAQGKEDALFAAMRPNLPADPTAWTARQADLVWELHPANAVDWLKNRAASPSLTADARQQALTTLGFIHTPTAARAMLALSQVRDTTLARQADYWVTFRRGNDWATLLNWDEAAPLKLSVDEQQMLALRQQLLDGYVPEADKLKVALSMAKSPEGGRILVGLTAGSKLPESVRKAVSGQIFSNPDRTVQIMAGDYFVRNGVTRTISIRQVASLTGDGNAGLAVLGVQCATCHRHGTLGADIGPNLSNIHEKFDRNDLLNAIVNPSAAIAFGYEPWLITTKNGQTYYGFLLSDGPQAVVIKDAAGQKHTLATARIASRRQYTTSLMPDPVAMGLSDQQLADLTAYLLKR